MLNRRDFLVSATPSLALGALGLGRIEASEQTRTPLILLFCSGGISSKEFTNPDPPSTPASLRGPLNDTATRTTGVHFSEVFPELAARTDRFALLRAVDAGSADHVAGAVNLVRDGSRTISERIGERAANGGVPYALLHHNRTWSALDSAFQRHLAFVPAWDGQKFVPPAMAATDLTERRRLLEAFDRPVDAPMSRRMDRFRATAFDLLQGGGSFFSALNLPEQDRERYGKNLTGDMVLTAKRLVESGAGAVTIYHEKDSAAWDMHGNIGAGMRREAPELDHAAAMLIDEIAENRLNAVLLIATEFNRTTAINSSGGRDHNPHGSQAILAGGRIRPGVYGRTNPRGEMMDVVQQRGQLGNTILSACGEELSPALPRVRDVLR